METTQLKTFNYLEDGTVSFSNLDTIETTNKLKPNIYELSAITDKGYVEMILKLVKKEEAKVYEFVEKNNIEKVFDAFFNKQIKEKVNSLKFIHKLGVLFYGMQGTGKTSICHYYSQKFIENNEALVFYINYSDYIKRIWDFIIKIRSSHINPIVIIFDEFESLAQGHESTMKNILDGYNSIDNCLFFATTNYIDKVPKAISERPSRFKYSINIEGIQIYNDVYKIVHSMLFDIFQESDLELFTKQLLGKTIDEIKQFCLDKIMNIENFNNKKYKIGFNK